MIRIRSGRQGRETRNLSNRLPNAEPTVVGNATVTVSPQTHSRPIVVKSKSSSVNTSRMMIEARVRDQRIQELEEQIKRLTTMKGKDHTSELKSLSAKIANMERKVTSSPSNVRMIDHSQELQELSRKLNALDNSQKDHSKDLGEIASKLSTLDTKITKTVSSQEMKNVVTKLQSLERKLAETRARTNDSLSREVKDIGSKLGALEKVVSAHDNGSNEHSHELQSIGSKLGELEKRIQEYNSAQLQQHKSDTDGNNHTQKALADILQKIQELEKKSQESEKVDYSDTIHDLTSKIQGIESKISEPAVPPVFVQELKAITTRIKEVEKLVTDKGSTVANVVHIDHSQELQELREKLNTLETNRISVQPVTNISDSNNIPVQIIQSTDDETKKELQNLISKLSELETKVNKVGELEDKLNQSKQEADPSHSQYIREIGSKLGELEAIVRTQPIDDHSHALAQLSSKLGELEERVKAQPTTDHSSEITLLKEQLGELSNVKKTLESYTTDLSSMKQTLGTINKENTLLTEQIKDLTTKLGSLPTTDHTEALANLSKQLETLATKVNATDVSHSHDMREITLQVGALEETLRSQPSSDHSHLITSLQSQMGVLEAKLDTIEESTKTGLKEMEEKLGRIIANDITRLNGEISKVQATITDVQKKAFEQQQRPSSSPSNSESMMRLSADIKLLKDELEDIDEKIEKAVEGARRSLRNEQAEYEREFKKEIQDSIKKGRSTSVPRLSRTASFKSAMPTPIPRRITQDESRMDKYRVMEVPMFSAELVENKVIVGGNPSLLLDGGEWKITCDNKNGFEDGHYVCPNAGAYDVRLMCKTLSTSVTAKMTLYHMSSDKKIIKAYSIDQSNIVNEHCAVVRIAHAEAGDMFLVWVESRFNIALKGAEHVDDGSSDGYEIISNMFQVVYNPATGYCET